MGDERKNMGDGETPPAKSRPGVKSVAVPSPVAAEAPQRPVTAPGPAAVESSPTPVAVETPRAASSPAAVEAAATTVAVETPAAASGAMVLAGGAVAVAAAGGDVMTLLESDVPKTLLFCDECRGHLKPPLYQCSRMLHVACSGCVVGGDEDDDDGYECASCTDLAASAVYVKSSYLDTLFSNTKVACPYRKYGCASSLAFRDAAAHAAACGFAPCLCQECSFEGLPADLVRHLTDKSGRHGWAIHKITYGKDHEYAVDALKSKGMHHELLVAEEDGGVFLLAIEYHEEAEMDLLFLVCVRNKTGAGPVYSSSVAVESPPAVGFSIKVERKKVMVSCSVPAEFLKEPDRNYFTTVFREMLHGEQSKKLHVCVCISKTQSISE